MKIRRFAILFAIMSLLLVGIGATTLADSTIVTADFADNFLNNGLPQGWGIVRVDDLALEMLETPPFLVDVREPNEYDEGFIPGAINLPLRDLAVNLNLLPTDLDAPIVIYCKSGHRGAIGTTVLQMLGYTNVRNLGGGILAWMGADYETDTEPVMAVAGDMPDIDPDLVAHMDYYLHDILLQGWGMVSNDDLTLELLEAPPVLLDVREPAEWEELGVIEGATLISIRNMGIDFDMLPTDFDTPIVVYCKSGYRGAIAMTVLGTMGYTNVRNLAGGILGWISAGYDVVAPEMMMAEEELDVTAWAADYLANGIPEGWGIVAVDDLALSMLETSPYIVDLRQPEEWEELGYIPGAINIPLRELAQNLDLLPGLDDAIVVYCKSGHRSAVGMTVLQMLGYSNVRSLKGGFNAWSGENYEIETAPVEVMAGDWPNISGAKVEVMDNYLMNVLPQGWGVVKADDLALELIEMPPFLLDVRNPSELFDHGYIEGAVNIPLRELGMNFDMLPEMDTPMVIYCHSGHRAAIGMTVLQVLDYDVRSLLGAILSWDAAGYELAFD